MPELFPLLDSLSSDLDPLRCWYLLVWQLPDCDGFKYEFLIGRYFFIDGREDCFVEESVFREYCRFNFCFYFVCRMGSIFSVLFQGMFSAKILIERLLDFLFLYFRLIRLWFLFDFFNPHPPIRAQINRPWRFATSTINCFKHQIAFAQFSRYCRGFIVPVAAVLDAQLSVFCDDEPDSSFSLSLQFKFHAALCCKYNFHFS